MVPRRLPFQEESTAPDVCQIKPVPVRAGLNARKRRNPAGLTPQQVRRVCTADSVSALARDPHTGGADPAGLAWSAVCCTLLYTLL